VSFIGAVGDEYQNLFSKVYGSSKALDNNEF
jgi:hypothetical protein